MQMTVTTTVNRSDNVHANTHERDQKRINKEISVKPKQSRLRKNQYFVQRLLVDEINTNLVQKELDKDKRLNARLQAIKKRKNR